MSSRGSILKRQGLPVLLIISAFSLTLGLLSLARTGISEFASCRNHSSFIVGALNEYITKHGWLPLEAGVKGEDLFCRLDFRGIGQNCHRGAPGQVHGGWQMLNASRKSWERLLERSRTKAIPVVWCGRSHSPGRSMNYGSGAVRIVIVIDPTGNGPGVGRNLFCTSSIVYGMPDLELAAVLTEINLILKEEAEAEIPIDVRGHSDYWSMAEPHQTY